MLLALQLNNLLQAVGEFTLSVDNLSIAITADQPALGTGTVLAVQDMTVSISAEPPTLTQQHILAPDSMSVVITAGAASIFRPGRVPPPERVFVLH